MVAKAARNPAMVSAPSTVGDSKDLSQRKAILVIPGLNKIFTGTQTIRDYFGKAGAKLGYDTFCFELKYGDSLGENRARLEQFYKDNHLAEYATLDVLSYIVAGWILNPVLNEHLWKNVKSVVYDRSPLQERLREVIATWSPRLTKVLFGGVIDDFVRTPYQADTRKDLNIGIVIENRPTKMAQHFEADIRELGPVSFDPKALKQPSQDHLYAWMNHDQMYKDIDQVGPEVLNFFEQGSFSPHARRAPFPGDPFDRERENRRQTDAETKAE